MLKLLICAAVMAVALLASARTADADPTGDLDEEILDIMKKTGEADSVGKEKGNRKDSEKDDTREKIELALKCENGDGVKLDAPRAVRLYKDAAAQGSGEAEAHLCRVYHDGIYNDKDKEIFRHDYALAHSWCEKAAGHGSADALYTLGDMFYRGCGVAENKKKGFDYTKMAAEKGHIKAHERLRLAYTVGEGTKTDCWKATEHLEYIIRHEPKDGLFIKGKILEHGDACTKLNRDLARKFYREACEKGNSFACWAGAIYDEKNNDKRSQ